MTTEKPTETAETQPPPTDVKAEGTLGWLTSLRNRLGLSNPQTLRDTIEGALKGTTADTDPFTVEEREMLKRLLRFGGSRVVDIMVPRADITAIEETETLAELLRTFEEAGVSRVPVYHDTLDDPRGMVHIKDLLSFLIAEAAGRPLTEHKVSPAPLKSGTPKPPSEPKEAAEAYAIDFSKVDLNRTIAAAKVRRSVLYVPPSMPAANLLIRMQATRIHMALVVDEYGGTDGLVTIEDLVEQIVGDIEDEHDEADDQHIAIDPKYGLVASGRTPVSELEERFSLKLLTPDEEEEIDTLGGLLFTHLGRVPARGEIVHHSSGLEFEVIDADPRRVKKVRIVRPKSADTGQAKA